MTREQLYTTVSRGRTTNHLYIAVGDDEPHRVLIDDIQEPTATDILQRVLSRTSLTCRPPRSEPSTSGQPHQPLAAASERAPYRPRRTTV